MKKIKIHQYMVKGELVLAVIFVISAITLFILSKFYPAYTAEDPFAENPTVFGVDIKTLFFMVFMLSTFFCTILVAIERIYKQLLD